jgi:hypothetical protein
MRYVDAIKLHAGDEVTVKRSNVTQEVVEIEIVEYIKGVSVRLTDGNWYGYKEIK